MKAVKGKSRSHPHVLWDKTKAACATNSAAYSHLHRSLLYTARHLIAKSSDLCRVDSWVVAHLPHGVRIKFLHGKHTLTPRNTQDLGTSIYGRVVEILALSETDAGLAVAAVLDVFDLKAACHPIFGMSVLARSTGQALYTIVPVKVGHFVVRPGPKLMLGQNVQFLFNAQHDCVTAKCTDSHHTPRRQEWLELEVTEPAIEHKPVDEYVINTHSLHNAHLLRKAIPRALISPIPLISPSQRQSEHVRAVAAWRLNPKSHTAQEEVRQEKKRAAERAKQEKAKNGRGKKRSADVAFKDEGGTKSQDPEGKMTLISDLAEAPRFLAGLIEGESTTSHT